MVLVSYKIKSNKCGSFSEPLKIPFLSYRRGRGIQEVKDISNMPSLDPLPHLPQCAIRLNSSKAPPYVLLATRRSTLFNMSHEL